MKEQLHTYHEVSLQSHNCFSQYPEGCWSHTKKNYVRSNMTILFLLLRKSQNVYVTTQHEPTEKPNQQETKPALTSSQPQTPTADGKHRQRH